MTEPTANELACVVANQIVAEQTLSNSRMTWNLTFQGFAIAGYALVATANGSEPAKIVIQILISLSAIIISGATFRSLQASQSQRDRLKRFWTSSPVIGKRFPAPFSLPGDSKRGRLAPLVICLTLMLMWSALVFAGIALTSSK